jgi:hypothetical protein
LVLEKLKDSASRDRFQSTRRYLGGRPEPQSVYSWRTRKRQTKDDLKADMAIGGLDMNHYDVAFLHVPYGPGWDIKEINKLVYRIVRPFSNRLVHLTDIC